MYKSARMIDHLKTSALNQASIQSPAYVPHMPTSPVKNVFADDNLIILVN